MISFSFPEENGGPFFGQLNYDSYLMQIRFDLQSQNLAGQLGFTYFDTEGGGGVNYIGNCWWKKAQKQSCRDELHKCH